MKVTFDGPNKKIIVNDGITELDVQIDLYSDWKEWTQENDNSKYLPAMRTVGGDPTTGIKSVAPYFFLINGWKIQPYDGNHTLTISGNLFVDEPEVYGSNIVVNVPGRTVLVNLSTTSDAIVVETGISGLTSEESRKLMELPNASENADAVWNEHIAEHQAQESFGKEFSNLETDMDFLIGCLKNKRLLRKEGSVWYLVVRNCDDSGDLLKKALKDKNGNNINDIRAEIMAQELKSSV